MKAQILEKSDEHLWDQFLISHPLASIHQTSSWGHFQEKIPSRGKYWIVALKEDQKIIGGTIIIRHKLPKGYCWFYAARGPLIDYSTPEKAHTQMTELLKEIKKIAKSQKAIFLRIDPPLTLNSPLSSDPIPPTFKSFYKTTEGFQPQHTLIVDLKQSEEEILAQMKPKGRYNIRLAEKKGVKIIKADPHNKEDFNKEIDAFYSLLNQTTSRDGFSSHDKEYYRIMLETLIPAQKGMLYLAEYEGQVIAGIIVTYFKDTAIYYYGASGNEHRNLMAPYLLQWHAIKDAKAHGHSHYDFLGIAPENTKNHPWAGVTDFKKKFGGKYIAYSAPQEHPFNSLLYLIYRAYKFIRKILK